MSSIYEKRFLADFKYNLSRKLFFFSENKVARSRMLTRRSARNLQSLYSSHWDASDKNTRQQRD